ncbi:MAG: hypothetical protein ACRDPB_11215 [Nocardioidaceae bacterium]
MTELLSNNMDDVEQEQPKGFDWEPVVPGGLEGGPQGDDTTGHGQDDVEVVVTSAVEGARGDDSAPGQQGQLAQCPPWCAGGSGTTDPGVHAHVSADVTAGTLEQPLVARLIQVAGSPDVRVLFNERVASVEEVSGFMSCVRQLLDQARPAAAGLGFLAPMIARAGLGHAELAEVSGLQVSWLRAQSAGGQVLTVHEFDQLALSVAHLLSETPVKLALDAG